MQLTLHAPNDVPMARQNYMKLSLSREVAIAVEPMFLATAAELESYAPEM